MRACDAPVDDADVELQEDAAMTQKQKNTLPTHVQNQLKKAFQQSDGLYDVVDTTDNNKDLQKKPQATMPYDISSLRTYIQDLAKIQIHMKSARSKIKELLVKITPYERTAKQELVQYLQSTTGHAQFPLLIALFVLDEPLALTYIHNLFTTHYNKLPSNEALVFLGYIKDARLFSYSEKLYWSCNNPICQHMSLRVMAKIASEDDLFVLGELLVKPQYNKGKVRRTVLLGLKKRSDINGHGFIPLLDNKDSRKQVFPILSEFKSTDMATALVDYYESSVDESWTDADKLKLMPFIRPYCDISVPMAGQLLTDKSSALQNQGIYILKKCGTDDALSLLEDYTGPLQTFSKRAIEFIKKNQVNH